VAKFVRGVPQTTRVPGITVDAGLGPGIHRFRLVVVDNDGLQSAPDEALIEVRASTAAPPGVLPQRSNHAKTRTHRSKR
jgi:hypothetical protein